MPEEVCCTEVIRLGERVGELCRKFNAWRWLVTSAIAVCIVMFSVSASGDAEKEKELAASLQAITEKLHQIDITVREVQTVQQHIVKQLEEHKREAKKKEGDDG